MKTQFWEKYIKADQFERKDLLEKLFDPLDMNERFEDDIAVYSFISLMRSYFDDLIDTMEALK